MRTITIAVLKPGSGAQASFCKAHAAASYAESLTSQGVPSVAGRLTLHTGECPRCVAEQLAAGRAVLAPDAVNAKGERVPLSDLRDTSTPVERELIDTLTAAADSAGAADLATALRAVRRAVAHPGSAETAELRDALRELLGPCCTSPVPAAQGEFRKAAPRWGRAA